MTLVPMAELPTTARLWVFASHRPLDRQEEDRLLQVTDEFLGDWEAHGTPLRAAREWREGRVLLVAVDQERAPPSGCSIDALVRALKGLEVDLEVRLVDKAPVWYRAGDVLRCVSREEFKDLASEGVVGPDVPVLDPTLTRLSELREGKLERPARETWHGKAFFRNTTRTR